MPLTRTALPAPAPAAPSTGPGPATPAPPAAATGGPAVGSDGGTPILAAGVVPVPPGAAALAEDLQHLQIANASALRVLALLDDPDVLIGDLGRLIGAEPSLAARVLGMANSSFFARRKEVTALDQAVMVLGLQTIRSLAVAAAFELFKGGRSALPPQFWEHACDVSAGAMVVARQVGLPAGDAFCAGLLHDLGTALLFRRDPDLVLDPAEGAEQLERETSRFGLDHAAAGALALAGAQIPTALVAAVAFHHEPIPGQGGRPSLSAVVAAGEALALGHDDVLLGTLSERARHDLVVRFEACRDDARLMIG